MVNTNIRFTAKNINKATLENTEVVNGSVYFVEDTKELFYDFGSKRTEVKDILILEKEVDRTSILFVPLNKFYFVLETSILWLYKDGTWYKISTSFDVDNKTIILNNSKLETVAIKTVDGTIKNEWIGTLAEYEAAIADGTITQTTECKITDDEQDALFLISKATTDSFGIVKVDGTSITSTNGIISVNSQNIEDLINSKLGVISTALDEINGEVIE